MVDLIASIKKMILSLVPDKLKKQLKTEKGTVDKGIMYVVLSLLFFLLVTAVWLIAIVLFSVSDVSPAEYPFASIDPSIGVAILVAIVVFGPIFLIMAFVVFLLGLNAVMYAFARFLGGKGTFSNQFYHFAVVDGGLTIVGSLLSVVPLIGQFLVFLPLVYFMYPVYLIYAKVHKLGKGRALILSLLTVVSEIIGSLIIFYGILLMFFVLVLFLLLPSGLD